MVERSPKPTKPEWILQLEEQADDERKSGANRPTVILPDIKNYKPVFKKTEKGVRKRKSS